MESAFSGSRGVGVGVGKFSEPGVGVGVGVGKFSEPRVGVGVGKF